MHRKIIVPAGTAPRRSPDSMSLHAQWRFVEWQELDTQSVVELHAATPSPAIQKPRAKKSNMQFSPEEPAKLNCAPRPQHISRRPDPAERLTHGATWRSYTYRAQRLRTVTIEGKVFELRSDLSSPVTLKFTDIFRRPHLPASRVCLQQATASRPSTSRGARPDTDLAGYTSTAVRTLSFEKLTTTPAGRPCLLHTAFAAMRAMSIVSPRRQHPVTRAPLR